VLVYVFFFQAEDGIRDATVTGVQTCALPICLLSELKVKMQHFSVSMVGEKSVVEFDADVSYSQEEAILNRLNRPGVVSEVVPLRSEERRVGKECRSRWAAAPDKYRRRNVRSL